MFRKYLKYRLQERAGEEGGGGGESPSAVNARGNNARLARINQIGETADSQRVDQLQDVDGERVVGRFQNGEMDDAPAARERRAQQEEDLAAEALREQEERAAEAERQEQEEARRLQEEGGGEGEGDEPGQRRTAARAATEEDDEKVIDGGRYYRTIVSGQEKWLTLKELREGAGASATASETLQRAQEALASASQAQLTPKAAPVEELSDQDLENIVLSAGMGDEEAVRKLVSVLKARPSGTNPQDVTRLVTQQIATQREVERAESAQAELLGNKVLEPIFRQRLREFAQSKPQTRIQDAYQAVGDDLRKDFAAMLKPSSRAPETKLDRKRTIVNPPASAGRQPARRDDDSEVPVGEQIDAIARARGQLRAHRIRRS